MAQTGGVELANELLKLIELHDASNIAAVIVEPMSSSAGVLVPPVGYLQRLREICDQHNILLIFDEVITAFGRLGTYSGAEYFGVTFDLMNVAKQVTNGAVPMGAVIASSEIYDTFMNQALPEHAVEFSHGYTYSAHPVACAAGLAALDILARDNLVQQSAELAPHFEKVLHGLQGAKNVIDIRNCGLAGAIQIAPRDGDPTVRYVRGRHEALATGFLRALRRRYPAIRPDLQRQAGRAGPPVRRGRRSAQRHRLMSGRPQAVPTVQVDNAEVIVTEWRFAPARKPGATATDTTMWWYR